MDEHCFDWDGGGILKWAGMWGLIPEKSVNVSPGLVTVFLQRWLGGWEHWLIGQPMPDGTC